MTVNCKMIKICKKVCCCFYITGQRTCEKIKDLCPAKLERSYPVTCSSCEEVFEEVEVMQNKTFVRRIPKEFIIP